jgi:hypothetical protein
MAGDLTEEVPSDARMGTPGCVRQEMLSLRRLAYRTTHAVEWIPGVRTL